MALSDSPSKHGMTSDRAPGHVRTTEYAPAIADSKSLLLFQNTLCDGDEGGCLSSKSEHDDIPNVSTPIVNMLFKYFIVSVFSEFYINAKRIDLILWIHGVAPVVCTFWVKTFV